MAHLLEILKNTIELVKQSYFTYWGVATNAALFYVALLYIFHVIKGETFDKKQDKAILWLVAVASFVIVCPLSAWFIMKYCVESAVYRRMFWMLPVSLLIGYAGTKFLFQEQTKGRKWMIGLAMGAIIAGCGVNMYANGAFQKAENPYKLWKGIPEVCDAILEDAKENGMDEVRVIGGADEFAIQARQYSAKIHMPYGRNGVRGEKIGKRATYIYEALHNEEGLDAKKLVKWAKKGNYQYLVYYNREEFIPILEAVGYKWLTEIDGYYIFKL